MKILYLDCSMGAAGDMLCAALTELLPDPDSFISEMNALGIPGVEISREDSVRCGIKGTHIRVSVNGICEEHHIHEHGHDHEHEHEHEHKHHHSHTAMSDIEHTVSHLNMPESVKNDVVSVYKIIADAESRAHGVSVHDIHFHEVGTADAIADIAAVCMLINKLSPDEIIVSPIRVGYGQVQCAHGILPVPAPATAYILQGIPVYSGEIKGEMCTPTGAALIKYFASRFGEMPEMIISHTGYGMGTKDFEAANCLRAVLGEASDFKENSDKITELICNVDDMTAENIGFAIEKVLEAGALDAYTVPAYMKKSRPGTVICVLCRPNDKENMAALLFRYTTTIGIRENNMKRYILDRHTEEIETKYGTVRRKISSGYGVTRAKYEYDDISRIASENGTCISDIIKQIDKQ